MITISEGEQKIEHQKKIDTTVNNNVPHWTEFRYNCLL